MYFDCKCIIVFIEFAEIKLVGPFAPGHRNHDQRIIFGGGSLSLGASLILFMTSSNTCDFCYFCVGISNCMENAQSMILMA